MGIFFFYRRCRFFNRWYRCLSKRSRFFHRGRSFLFFFSFCFNRCRLFYRYWFSNRRLNRSNIWHYHDNWSYLNWGGCSRSNNWYFFMKTDIFFVTFFATFLLHTFWYFHQVGFVFCYLIACEFTLKRHIHIFI